MLLLIPRHPAMIANQDINVEHMMTKIPAPVVEDKIDSTISSSAAVRGFATDPDAVEELQTNRPPSLVSASEKKMQGRVRLQTKRVGTSAVAGKRSAVLGELAYVVLVRFAERVSARLRAEDKPADVAAMNIQLTAAGCSVQIRSRRAARNNERFTYHVVTTLAAVGMTTVALEYLYASLYRATAKPPSANANVTRIFKCFRTRIMRSKRNLLVLEATGLETTRKSLSGM